MPLCLSHREAASVRSGCFLTHPHKVLMAYMNTNRLKGKWDGRIID